MPSVNHLHSLHHLAEQLKTRQAKPVVCFWATVSPNAPWRCVWDALTGSVSGPLLSIIWGLLKAINRPSLNSISRAYKGFPEVSIATPQLRGWRMVEAHPLPEEEGWKKCSGARGCEEELGSLLPQPQSWKCWVVTTSPLHHLATVATSHRPSQQPWRKISSRSVSPLPCQPQSQQQSWAFCLPPACFCSGSYLLCQFPEELWLGWRG